MPVPTVEVEAVPCPDCRRVLAVLDPLTRQLHAYSRDRPFGALLEADIRVNVEISCDHCRTRRWQMSGRGVARRIREKKPPLPA
jgi:hypothetical protein